MKRNILIFLILSQIIFLFSCVEKESYLMTVQSPEDKGKYGSTLNISPMDESVIVRANSILILPTEESVTYTLSGYFNGQVVVGTKNTVIKLDNVFLENTSGQAALKCEAKTEVSTVKDSVNYIVSRGRGFAAKGALQARRGLVLGGSGSLFIKGSLCHGIEARDVKIKGSGKLTVQGTKRGSALCSEQLIVEPEKTFEAYFLNSKNGIKAENMISISSGNFFLYNNEVALKTDLKNESPYENHCIILSGGVFHLHGNKNLQVTEKDSFVDTGAIFVEE